MAYLRDKNKCPRYWLYNKNDLITIAKYIIKNSNDLNKNNIKFNFKCINFPCKETKNIDKIYRTKYNMGMIENLENIKKLGLREF